MTRFFYFLTTILLFVVVTSNIYANKNSSGISFYVLRVIYSQEEKNGVTLTAYNNTNASYLMQSFIRPINPKNGDVDIDWEGTSPMPFIVTPPLSRFEANGELTVRIRRSDTPLPDDRESVFFISMKAMPAQPQAPEKGKISMTVISNLKLFYRPSGLAKRALADVAPKLIFHKEGSMLVANNPTPYWITFSRLAIGKRELEKPALRLMVPPFGNQVYALPDATDGKVTWQLIDEDGWNTPEVQQVL